MEKTLLKHHLITKNGIINLILGVILLGFSIYAMFFSDLLSDSLSIVVGVLILWFTVIRFMKDLNTYKNKHALMILAGELVLDLVAVYFLVFTQAAIARYLGLVLYARGVVYFLILQILNLKGNFEKFILYMIVLTAGAYILFANNAFENELQFVLFAILVLYAVLLIAFGAILLKKKKS